jgi:hypothetical protein
MRKVILMMPVSVDGFIEGPERELDWHKVAPRNLVSLANGWCRRGRACRPAPATVAASPGRHGAGHCPFHRRSRPVAPFRPPGEMHARRPVTRTRTQLGSCRGRGHGFAFPPPARHTGAVTADQLAQISTDPRVVHGQAVIAGTRVPVSVILDYLAAA